jgi:hypothetical protein
MFKAVKFKESLNLRSVVYFNIVLQVFIKYKYIATDKDGRVYAYKSKPKIDTAMKIWVRSGDENPEAKLMGYIEYEGDWKESLLKIKGA